jgi:hypothetical protein
MHPRSFMTQDNYARIWKDKSIAEAKMAVAERAHFAALESSS